MTQPGFALVGMRLLLQKPQTMSEIIFTTAQQLRLAIDRAKAAGADIPWLTRFPENCCNFASNLLLLDLADAGVGRLRRVIATICDAMGNDVGSHVWVRAETDWIVDITADHYGQPNVIVDHTSDWHSSLKDEKPFIPRQDLPEGVAPTHLERISNLYADVRQALAPHYPVQN